MPDFQLSAANQGIPGGSPVPPSQNAATSPKRIDGTPLAAGILVIAAVASMGILRRVFRGVVL